MDENQAQQWADQVKAARERADVATKALFTLRYKLDEAAKGWARMAEGYPMQQSLNALARDCDRAWHDAIQANEHERGTVKVDPTTVGADLGTLERESLLKLVIGMAIEGYKYSPDAARNTATADIANDLAKLGLTMTDDTVRKWLKQAAKTVLPERPLAN